jgi:predicted nucleic acid-binding protein
MNILFDTNVILDVLLKRELFVADAVKLFNAVEKSAINGFVCANSISTIAYNLNGNFICILTPSTY